MTTTDKLAKAVRGLLRERNIAARINARKFAEEALAAYEAGAKPAPTLWPLAPLTGYYSVNGKQVWLEKDDPFPTDAPASPAEPVVVGHHEFVAARGQWRAIIWTDKPLPTGTKLHAAPAAPAHVPEADFGNISDLLPGTYYMDPPDGGSVTLREQFERMATDAARYRWILRNYLSANLPAMALKAGNLDAAIDAAIEASKGGAACKWGPIGCEYPACKCNEEETKATSTPT